MNLTKYQIEKLTYKVRSILYDASKECVEKMRLTDEELDEINSLVNEFSEVYAHYKRLEDQFFKKLHMMPKTDLDEVITTYKKTKLPYVTDDDIESEIVATSIDKNNVAEVLNQVINKYTAKLNELCV